MPSHKIHIKIAQDVNKVLNRDNDSIMLGSVLPDLTLTKNHGLSHFQYVDEYPYNLANANEFIKKYHNMKDDISIGYITHLLTDRFYNDWYYNNYKLKGIITTKEFKHNLFASYDNYLLKHFKLDSFKDMSVIEKIPKYKDLVFDIEYLKEYILKYNDEVRNSGFDTNYKIDNFDVLDELYNTCQKYVLEELEKLNI